MPVLSLRRRQIALVGLLFAGYASLYFCRADLSVATPLLVEELQARGLSQQDALLRMGTITSLGTLGYAVGKLFLGGLGDFWGGRINFLIGLAGATVFTLLFAVTGLIPILHPRLAGKPAHPVAVVGGIDQGFVEMVRLLLLRHCHRHPERQFPRRRRRGPPVDGDAHPSWIRLARPVLLCRGGRGRLPAAQFSVPA